MVKKKAGGAKKSKEASGPSQEELAEKYQLPPLEFKSEMWVTLHVKKPRLPRHGGSA
jgi:hypothetical protein